MFYVIYALRTSAQHTNTATYRYYKVVSHPTVFPRLLDSHPTVPFCFSRIRTFGGSSSCAPSTQRSGLGHPLDCRSYFSAGTLVDLRRGLPKISKIHNT